MTKTSEKIIKTFKRSVVTEVTGLSFPEAMRNDVVGTGIMFAEYITFLENREMIDELSLHELDLWGAAQIAKYGEA